MFAAFLPLKFHHAQFKLAPGTDGEIEGCILDVQCMKHMLVSRFGFAVENVILVTELEKEPSQRPTKKNILYWMNWLVENASGAIVGH